MITIIGGTYIETCIDPYSYELYGSGLRGAIALSEHVNNIDFRSCIGRDKLRSANIICSSFGINSTFSFIPETISFNYYHPLSKPTTYPEITLDRPRLKLPEVSSENILMYGQIEASASIKGDYVVYDPQSWIPFKETESTAVHLALVLNRDEAIYLSGSEINSDLRQVGHCILETEGAEVVVIKNGSQGATVIDSSGSYIIPVFDTPLVWPVGSGDVFSAVFAWQWAINRESPKKAAELASLYTAGYCANRLLPLPAIPTNYEALIPVVEARKIYLAGPFFTIAERWLINEIRNKLIEFGNKVFSPYHDVGVGTTHQIVSKDLIGIQDADLLFAILNGVDPGTLFEIGYAKALGKKVLLFVENINKNDLTMLVGTDCIIVDDFSTAIYKASW